MNYKSNNYYTSGVTVLIDLKGAGIKNADLDMQKFLVNVLENYYPGLVGAGLVYKLPGILEAIYKIARNMINQEHQKYIYLTKKKNLNNYIAKDQLPDFLLGTCTKSYRSVPTNAPTAQDLAKKLCLKEGKAEKLVKHLEPFFSE
jgi:hypothetical protein